MEILLAIVIGAAFGAVLDRIGATNPTYIGRMLALTNLNLMKTILLAIGTGSVLMFAGQMIGLVDVGHYECQSRLCRCVCRGSYARRRLGGLWLLPRYGRLCSGLRDARTRSSLSLAACLGLRPIWSLIPRGKPAACWTMSWAERPRSVQSLAQSLTG